MTMKNPPHPGLSVRHDCIEPLDLTITEAADILGVTRQALNNLVNGKSGISPENTSGRVGTRSRPLGSTKKRFVVTSATRTVLMKVAASEIR